MTRRNYLAIGITGGIGSGKTTVCNLFAKRNRVVVSADHIANDLTEKDEKIRREISSAFGPEIYSDDGSLDRRALARIVFKSPSRRDLLNSIVHPPTLKRIQQYIEQLPPEKRFPYVLVEAALIFETGMNTWLDFTLVVAADEENRIARVMRRDAVSREDVLLRIKSQMSADNKVRRADYVLWNNFSVDDLADRVMFFDNLFTKMAKGIQ